MMKAQHRCLANPLHINTGTCLIKMGGLVSSKWEPHRLDSSVHSNTEHVAGERQNCQREQGNGPRVRQRVHLFHHQRGIGQVPAGEEKNDQRRGFAVGHVHVGLRQVCRTVETVPQQVPGSCPRRKARRQYRSIQSATGVVYRTRNGDDGR